MISIRKKEFFTTIPTGVIQLIGGIISIIYYKQLSVPLTLKGTGLVVLFGVVPIFCGYYYVWKNRERFEPFDELTEKNIANAYATFYHLHLVAIAFVGLIVAMLKPQLEYHVIASFALMYCGSAYILKYILFLIADRMDV